MVGYVWREAYDGDDVCVTPDVRAATAADNQMPTTASLATTCLRSGHLRGRLVWRGANCSDHVCVLPSVRKQVAADNVAASSRVDSGDASASDTCISGYVWREAYDGITSV